MSIPAILREFGLTPETIFQSAGLSPAQFTDADTEVSYLAASRLLARCAAATGCDHFGLLVGQRAAPSSLGVAGFLVRSAARVELGLRALVQHLDLHEEGGTPTLVVEGNTAKLGYLVYQPGAEATDQIYDAAIAVACNIMRSLCVDEWNPTGVLLSRRPPRTLSPYRGFFRAPIRFDASENALLFPRHWMDHRIPSADPLLFEHLQKEAVELHAVRHPTTLQALRALLRKSLLAHHCTAADIAERLCVHERTLNRRLRTHGTTFRRELDAVRQELAEQLLSSSSMPVSRIATALNYADVSSFSRAFKRWRGITPAEFRERDEPST